MQKLLVAVTFLCFFATHYCVAQAPAVRAGSREFAKALADTQRRAAQAAEEWRLSKKLSIMETPPTSPDTLHDQHECMDPEGLNVGAVGYLEYWQYNIAQVIGPNDLILTIRNPRIPPVWLTNYPTKGLADDDLARIIGAVEVTGTKSYETVAGASKTVRVIRFVTPARIAEIEAEKAAAEEAALTRTWTDNSGKFTFTATFVEFKGNHVHLVRKEDGKTVAVLMSRLCEDDQDWVRKEVQARREKEKSEKKKR